MRVLVVKSAFKDYKVGDIISDAKAVAEVWGSPQKIHVVPADHAEVPFASKVEITAIADA